MATPELVLRFPDPTRVCVRYEDEETTPFEFTSPVTDKDRADLRWYVETYGAQSLADPDDADAKRIEARLPGIGKDLFKAVFADERDAQRLFDRFQDADDDHRVLTIDSECAAILALPWELLHDPNGTFLFREHPHISVRRRITGATGERRPFRLAAKPTLHLLFVVSRPDDAGFIDPRTDPGAVLDALEQEAPGRVTWEFLRPATLDALKERLDDENRPPIDILHFDGHGSFEAITERDVLENPGAYGPKVLSEIQCGRPAQDSDGADTPIGVGFLLFEQADRGSHYISAGDLANHLYRRHVGLVILSACQTAALDAAGDPMASVAGRLTATGIPAVLAMTHSVLAATTRGLFGAFYLSLARGRGLASALDDARGWLASNPGKCEVRRGDGFRTLELQDWFLPALFHTGADAPLLIAGTQAGGNAHAPVHNLRRPHEAGFFGRRRELWAIERWFAGPTRRLSVCGFGGQGKTELAMEAGRWLLRTGLFARAVFVDYSQAATADAPGLAVATLGAVLGETLADAREAGAALATAPTLVILDNLETVEPAGLAALLDAARDWSERGGTRVLLTSRNPDQGHPDYRIEGTHRHRRILLEGLGSAAYPDDALDWFAALAKLPGTDPDLTVPPPKRDELIALFDRVAFHPLSIAVLVQQLRTRTAQQLGERLEALLQAEAVSGIALPGTPPSLIASLRLSLDRLEERERRMVGRLGVFQGGAMENNLLAITGLREHDERPQGRLRSLLAKITWRRKTYPWPPLRRQLEYAGLIEAESIRNVGPPYLRFHPTLAPLLWAELDGAERERLGLAHRRRYYALANYLYQTDNQTPEQARAIARREMPNLLHAVDRALEARDEYALHFVACVNRFLHSFRRIRESEELTCRVERAGEAVGTDAWYLAQLNRGDQLLAQGQVKQAAGYFQAILETLGGKPSFLLIITLSGLGRCYAAEGRPDLAEAQFRRGIQVTVSLGDGHGVKEERGQLYTALGTALKNQGRLREARAAYEVSLAIMQEITGNPRSEGVVFGQLGTLALREGNLVEAVRRYKEALLLFQRLGEPASEAIYQHQLGRVFQEARQWDQAERHYRESAVLEEHCGNLAGAAQTWTQLANVCRLSDRPQAAEHWYRKAIEGGLATGDTLGIATGLSNLADLLREHPGRLAEARQLAEQSLAIKETLDPGAAEIWLTYGTLAEIADRQSRPVEADKYRHLAHDAKRRLVGPHIK